MSFGEWQSFHLSGEAPHPDRQLMNVLMRDANEILSLLENDFARFIDRYDDFRFTGNHTYVHGASRSFGHEVRGRLIVDELRDVGTVGDLDCAERVIVRIGDDTT